MNKKTLGLWLSLVASPLFAFPQTDLVPGGLIVIDLGHSQTKPDVRFNKKSVMLQQNQKAGWQALVGIPLNQPEGKLTVNVNGQDKQFDIKGYPYPEQHLSVQNKHVNPNTSQQNQISNDFKKMGPVYSSFSAATDFNGMYWPIRGTQSSGFGLKRYFNGQPRAPHSGLDIASPTGTPIMAPAAGKVVLAGDFYFNGNSVFIDHGQGLISMLCHMSRIDVKEGDSVNIGDQIGLVGATGRVTGPHLHWTVSLNNARINPKLLLAEGEAKESKK